MTWFCSTCFTSADIEARKPLLEAGLWRFSPVRLPISLGPLSGLDLGFRGEQGHSKTARVFFFDQ